MYEPRLYKHLMKKLMMYETGNKSNVYDKVGDKGLESNSGIKRKESRVK